MQRPLGLFIVGEGFVQLSWLTFLILVLDFFVMKILLPARKVSIVPLSREKLLVLNFRLSLYGGKIPTQETGSVKF